jgi:hypothetical protein
VLVPINSGRWGGSRRWVAPHEHQCHQHRVWVGRASCALDGRSEHHHHQRTQRGASERRRMGCTTTVRGVRVRVQDGAAIRRYNRGGEIESDKDVWFFNKLADKMSDGLKTQRTRWWVYGSIRRFAYVGHRTCSITVQILMRKLFIVSFIWRLDIGRAIVLEGRGLLWSSSLIRCGHADCMVKVKKRHFKFRKNNSKTEYVGTYCHTVRGAILDHMDIVGTR